jgi:hypothetical protein
MIPANIDKPAITQKPALRTSGNLLLAKRVSLINDIS